jgi:hypothetical protein
MFKLANLLNQEFGPPFLPQGFVKAEIEDDGSLRLTIGRRDVSVGPCLNVLGAGTGVGPGGAKWKITRQ